MSLTDVWCLCTAGMLGPNHELPTLQRVHIRLSLRWSFSRGPSPLLTADESTGTWIPWALMWLMGTSVARSPHRLRSGNASQGLEMLLQGTWHAKWLLFVALVWTSL